MAQISAHLYCIVFSNRFQNCQNTYSVKCPVPNSYGIFVPIIETKIFCRMKIRAKIAIFPCGKPMIFFREETTDEIWVIIPCSLFGQEYNCLPKLFFLWIRILCCSPVDWFNCLCNFLLFLRLSSPWHRG